MRVIDQILSQCRAILPVRYDMKRHITGEINRPAGVRT